MLNVAQLIDGKSVNLNHTYLINNPEEFLVEQKEPKIRFYGFQGMFGTKLKGELTKIATNDFKQIMKIGSSDPSNYFFLGNSLNKTKETLENLKFKNYHKFWDKSGWKNKGGSILDLLSLGLGGIIATEDYLSGIGVFAFGEIFLEAARRQTKNNNQIKLEHLEEIKTSYRNFIHNVTKSKISEIYVPEVQQTINEVKELKGKLSTRYLKFDFNQINKDLKQSYALRGFK